VFIFVLTLVQYVWGKFWDRLLDCPCWYSISHVTMLLWLKLKANGIIYRGVWTPFGRLRLPHVVIWYTISNFVSCGALLHHDATVGWSCCWERKADYWYRCFMGRGKIGWPTRWTNITKMNLNKIGFENRSWMMLVQN